MRHLFIVNPAAGKKKSTEILLKKLEELNKTVELDIVMNEGA